MESILIVVTLVSLGLAMTMTVVAWTLMRNERQRTAARVEALEALAFADGPSGHEISTAPAAEPVQRRMTGFEDEESLGDLAPPARHWDLALRERPAGDADAAADNLRPAALSLQSRPDEMFDSTPAPGVLGRRWLAVAAVALIVAAGVATYSALKSPEILAAVAASRPATPAAPATDGQPLELLSLRHSTDAEGAFTVTGLVQNPRSGRELQKVEAVVYLFDNDDHYFASERAMLDVSAVQPGDESPFVVKLPNATGVSRYRVGFRQGDGRVVAHVDRRGRLPAGTTGDTLTGESELAKPAGGMRPVDGAFRR